MLVQWLKIFNQNLTKKVTQFNINTVVAKVADVSKEHIYKSLNIQYINPISINISLAIMFLSSKTQGAYKMYVREGKDVELAPNTRNTIRLIWIISLLYFAIGTFVLWIYMQKKLL